MRNGVTGRIVLALDASPRSRAALEAAAALAAALDIELAGVFIEDINLLHLGGLPFTREVGLFSPALRPFGVVEAERALRREADEAQHLLSETAARLRLRWSFQVARGQVATELFALTAEPDLIVLGKRARMGAMSLADFLAEPLRPTTRRVHQPRSVAVVYDASAAAQHALELAQQLAHANDMPLRVLIPGATDKEYAAREGEARKVLPGNKATFQRITSVEPRLLAATWRSETVGVLVLDADSLFRGGEGFYTLLNDLDCPVVLVGRGSTQQKRAADKPEPASLQIKK